MRYKRIGSTLYFYKRDKNGFSLFRFDGLYRFIKQANSLNTIKRIAGVI